ncbi:phosphotransferase [Gordonia sp. TBRC 11910]|uniref:Hydroxylysine kinase n=1 Tax=Gordonia asplenii TaxID=2725283 RepID=A0A848L0D4_9ACTN|nr:phosphotransferase [Gordonia asplenii]NMO04420.1 phosphotransferase [Gordonia asplenii]
MSPLAGERDDNFRVATEDSTWMLKIVHSAEPWTVTRFQSEILAHLAGGPVSAPRLITTVDGEPHARLDDGRAIRMTSFSPGVKIRMAKSQNLFRLGAAIADLDAALADLDPGDYGQDLAWDLQQPERACRLLDDLPQLDSDGTLSGAFERFDADVAPRLAMLPSQLVHNDANPDNILVDGDRFEFIDFGDAVVAPRVVDLAVAASYFVGAPSALDGDPVLGAATDVLVGYHRRTPLNDNEIGLLHELLIARVVTAITIASWNAEQSPGNRDYLLRHTGAAWHRLEILNSADRDGVARDLEERLAAE